MLDSNADHIPRGRAESDLRERPLLVSSLLRIRPDCGMDYKGGTFNRGGIDLRSVMRHDTGPQQPLSICKFHSRGEIDLVEAFCGWRRERNPCDGLATNFSELFGEECSLTLAGNQESNPLNSGFFDPGRQARKASWEDQ
jgi:hypothetical protein